MTFDEGYENGYTNKILDVLKEKNVKAIFFVTAHYITYSPDTVKRMVAEGHVVGNHINHHYSMPSVTYSKKVFNSEITDTENKFKELTKEDMPKFFRPPMGKYSINSLKKTNDLGYKSIFWSFAYADWDTQNVAEPAAALQKVTESTHPGAIFLLHAVSPTNAEILGQAIDSIRSQGYTFTTAL